MAARKPKATPRTRGVAPSKAKRRRLRDDPKTTIPELCRQGQHPISRKIGRGCAACGNVNAWPR